VVAIRVLSRLLCVARASGAADAKGECCWQNESHLKEVKKD
jgi:hypothetical protein